MDQILVPLPHANLDKLAKFLVKRLKKQKDLVNLIKTNRVNNRLLNLVFDWPLRARLNLIQEKARIWAYRKYFYKWLNVVRQRKLDRVRVYFNRWKFKVSLRRRTVQKYRKYIEIWKEKVKKSRKLQNDIEIEYCWQVSDLINRFLPWEFSYLLVTSRKIVDYIGQFKKNKHLDDLVMHIGKCIETLRNIRFTNDQDLIYFAISAFNQYIDSCLKKAFYRNKSYKNPIPEVFLNWNTIVVHLITSIAMFRESMQILLFCDSGTYDYYTKLTKENLDIHTIWKLVLKSIAEIRPEWKLYLLDDSIRIAEHVSFLVKNTTVENQSAQCYKCGQYFPCKNFIVEKTFSVYCPFCRSEKAHDPIRFLERLFTANVRIK